MKLTPRRILCGSICREWLDGHVFGIVYVLDTFNITVHYSIAPVLYQYVLMD